MLRRIKKVGGRKGFFLHVRSLIRRKCSLERVFCCLFPRRAKEREAEIIGMTSIVFLCAQFEKHILSLKKRVVSRLRRRPFYKARFFCPLFCCGDEGNLVHLLLVLNLLPLFSSLPFSLFPPLAFTTGFWSKCVARETGKKREVVSAAAAPLRKPASAPPFCRLSLLPLIKKRFGSQSRKNKCIEQKKREKEKKERDSLKDFYVPPHFWDLYLWTRTPLQKRSISVAIFCGGAERRRREGVHFLPHIFFWCPPIIKTK